MKSINHNIAKFLRVICMIILAGAILWLFFLCTGCRSVKKSQDIEKTWKDSLVITKHDSVNTQKTEDLFKNFSAKNFKAKFVFDSNTIKQGIRQGNKKVPVTVPANFIENLINIAIANNAQSVEISADDLQDSTHDKTNMQQTKVSDDKKIDDKDQSKIKKGNKETNSGSNILWVLGTITAVVIIFFAVFKSATKKADIITAGIEKIEKL